MIFRTKCIICNVVSGVFYKNQKQQQQQSNMYSDQPKKAIEIANCDHPFLVILPHKKIEHH